MQFKRATLRSVKYLEDIYECIRMRFKHLCKIYYRKQNSDISL